MRLRCKTMNEIDKVVKAKKTILFVGNHFHSQTQNKNIWQEIPDRFLDLDFQVISTSHKENRILRIIDMWWTIIRFRSSYNLAIVDVFSGPAFIWSYSSSILLNLLQKKFILVLRGGNLPAYAKKKPSRVKRILRKASAIATPSHFLKESLKHFNHDIDVIPNPVDLRKFKFKMRHKLGLNLIWVRAFHRIYNPSLAPQVVAELVKEYPEIHLTMIGPDKGDGSLDKTIETLQSLNLEKNIEIVGKTPHYKIPDWLNKADIFINTTNVDNTPVSVLEAMSCGLGVVSTNVGGIPWLLKDKEDALLVPQNQSGAMANGILLLYKDPDFAGNLIKNAYEKVKDFDWSNVLPLWQKLIEKI